VVWSIYCAPGCALYEASKAWTLMLLLFWNSQSREEKRGRNEQQDTVIPQPLWKWFQELLGSKTQQIYKSLIENQITYLWNIITVSLYKDVFIHILCVPACTSTSVCIQVHMHMCICMNIEAKANHVYYSSKAIHFNFWDKVSHWPEVCPVG